MSAAVTVFLKYSILSSIKDIRNIKKTSEQETKVYEKNECKNLNLEWRENPKLTTVFMLFHWRKNMSLTSYWIKIIFVWLTVCLGEINHNLTTRVDNKNMLAN